MWYVIQSTDGKEEVLVSLIRNRVDKTRYRSCFVIKAESFKRLGGSWRVQTKTLFPGYVFIETEYPREINAWLLNAGISYLLGTERGAEGFVPLEPDEAKFLHLISTNEKEPVFSLTTLELSDSGEILRMDGSLSYFHSQIQRLNLRKRYAIVNLKIAGKEKAILFGIRLKKDIAVLEDETQKMERTL